MASHYCASTVQLLIRSLRSHCNRPILARTGARKDVLVLSRTRLGESSMVCLALLPTKTVLIPASGHGSQLGTAERHFSSRSCRDHSLRRASSKPCIDIRSPRSAYRQLLSDDWSCQTWVKQSEPCRLHTLSTAWRRAKLWKVT